MVAWQGRYCALNYNNFSSFMKHLYSQITCVPCDVHDCITCTAEAHQDFSHVDENAPINSMEATAVPSHSFKANLFPSFTAPSGKSRRSDIKKRLKSKHHHRGLSSDSAGSSPRALAMKHIAMSTTPRVQNPYEEEFIEEIILPREMRFSSTNGAAFVGATTKGTKSAALFPYIPQSPPSRPRRLKVQGGHSRRTVSAPGVPTSSLKTMLTKT